MALDHNWYAALFSQSYGHVYVIFLSLLRGAVAWRSAELTPSSADAHGLPFRPDSVDDNYCLVAAIGASSASEPG